MLTAFRFEVGEFQVTLCAELYVFIYHLCLYDFTLGPKSAHSIGEVDLDAELSQRSLKQRHRVGMP